MQTHFPYLSPLLETYYLTCLLHDLGTTTKNMHGTHMSFEYYGAFKALNFLLDNGASKDQAEAVSEAIIRHADLGETGTITSLGLLIQLSTVFGKFHHCSFAISILHCFVLRTCTHGLAHYSFAPYFSRSWNEWVTFCRPMLSGLQHLGWIIVDLVARCTMLDPKVRALSRRLRTSF